MSKVVTLAEVKIIPHKGMIELLENALERANAGELRGLGVIFIDRDSRVYTKAHNIDAKHGLVAGCEYLKHDICASDD